MKELNFSEITSVNGGWIFIPKLIVLGISAYGAGYGMGKYEKSKSEPLEPIEPSEPMLNNPSCHPTC